MALVLAIPALPVRSIDAAAAFYGDRLGFYAEYVDDGFAKLRRDAVELHLWAASDETWASRATLTEMPICSGAESFIAGTASCRIAVDSINDLYAEMTRASVLHPADGGNVVETDWGTREFATLDLDGNLITFFVRLANGVGGPDAD